MNVFLWILQIVLALHTAMGAVWKFSNSAEQTMPTLKAIPKAIWLALSVIELLCSVALILPVFYEPLAILTPVAATFIAAEMLLFSGLHLSSKSEDHRPIIYWLVTAAISAFVAFGRFVLFPL